MSSNLAKCSILATLAAAVLTLGPYNAAAERPGRYSMQTIEGGFLRLDTETGALSLCTGAVANFNCAPVKDEAVKNESSPQREVERLAAENRELKAEVRRLEDLLAQSGGERPVSRHRKLELPSEKDVDEAIGYMERMIRKFRDKLKDLDGGPGRGTPL